MVVGVVRANLSSGVAQLVEEGEIGVGRFDILLQCQLGEAREIAGPFGANEGIIRHIRGKQDFSGDGKLGAKIAPSLNRIRTHGATQSPPFTASAAPVISLA